MILLAEHDKPTLAAKKKRQHGALSWPTSTPKNRVWGFENTPSGRPVVEPELTQETATGSVQYTYQIASGRAEWLSRDPIAERGGINLYRYVGNEPINRLDPLGLTYADAAEFFGEGESILGGEEAAGWAAGGNFDPYVDAGLGLTAIGLGLFDIYELLKPGDTPTHCNASGQRGWGSGLPTKGGPPGGSLSDGAGDAGTIRDYDDNGDAETDYDFGHDHGSGDPHAHDWSNGTRGPGRPLAPGE